MNNYFNVVGVSSPGSALRAVSKNENIRVIGLPMKRNVSILSDLVSLVRMIVLLNKEKPTIVHTHTPKAGTIGIIASFLCRVPVRIHTIAGMPLLEEVGIKRKILELIERITLTCTTKVLVNSFNLKEVITKNKYCDDRKISVLGHGSSNGIDLTYFSPTAVSIYSVDMTRKRYGLTQKHFVFVFVGRLVGDKGINELVESFESIFESFPDSRLLLVGDYEVGLDPLQSRTNAIIENNVGIISVGYQTDIRPLLSVSNVLVFPSYREGFPNVVMQAGAMGLPSIVSDINGCNEIIVGGTNGIIIPPKNTEHLKDAMIQLLTDKNYYITLKNNCRKLILERYDRKAIWKLLKDEYDAQLKKIST